MAMATTTAHKGKPIWVTEGGVELPVTNIAAATALILNGTGKWSLDRALGLSLPRWLAPLGLVMVILTVVYAGSGNDEPEQDEAREGAAGNGEA
jgi:putative oxidoreductase